MFYAGRSTWSDPRFHCAAGAAVGAAVASPVGAAVASPVAAGGVSPLFAPPPPQPTMPRTTAATAAITNVFALRVVIGNLRTVAHLAGGSPNRLLGRLDAYMFWNGSIERCPRDGELARSCTTSRKSPLQRPCSSQGPPAAPSARSRAALHAMQARRAQTRAHRPPPQMLGRLEMQVNHPTEARLRDPRPRGRCNVARPRWSAWPEGFVSIASRRF